MSEVICTVQDLKLFPAISFSKVSCLLSYELILLQRKTLIIDNKSTSLSSYHSDASIKTEDIW